MLLGENRSDVLFLLFSVCLSVYRLYPAAGQGPELASRDGSCWQQRPSWIRFA
jgi:hypothetical protein